MASKNDAKKEEQRDCQKSRNKNLQPRATARVLGPGEGVGGGVNPSSRGVQHWYTPTLLAPTHCAQTFLVVVCSVHKMRPIQFSLWLSWRYLGAFLCVLQYFGLVWGRRREAEHVCSRRQRCLLETQRSENARFAVQQCGFWRSWLWADKNRFSFMYSTGPGRVYNIWGTRR